MSVYEDYERWCRAAAAVPFPGRDTNELARDAQAFERARNWARRQAQEGKRPWDLGSA